MRHPWFAKNRKGQASMGYVLLIALIATCLVAILGLTRKAANDAYTRTSDRLGPVGPGFGSSGGSWHPSADGAPVPTPPDSGGGDPADSAGAGVPSSAGAR